MNECGMGSAFLSLAEVSNKAMEGITQTCKKKLSTFNTTYRRIKQHCIKYMS
jgi:hypothetical protein